MGFVARERMTGWHELADGAGRQRFELRAEWGPERLLDWLDPRKPTFLWQELRGELRADGLCDWTPCAGTLHLQYFGARRVRYDVDFEVGGRTYRWLGDKVGIAWWNLPVSHTTCHGVITERSTGRLVSIGTTWFHLRDLPELLAVRAA